MNALSLPLTVFTQINFVADFLLAKCYKSAFLRFEPPFEELRGNVRWSS